MALETKVRIVARKASSEASGACVRSGHVDVPSLRTLGTIYAGPFTSEAVMITGRAGVTIFVPPDHTLIADSAVVALEAVRYYTAEFADSSVKIVIVIAADTGGLGTANCAAFHSNGCALCASFASVQSAHGLQEKA